ncbi:MAG TPA: hypothetical protein V6C76_06540 [Drouetiella sp.]
MLYRRILQTLIVIGLALPPFVAAADVQPPAEKGPFSTAAQSKDEEDLRKQDTHIRESTDRTHKVDIAALANIQSKYEQLLQKYPKSTSGWTGLAETLKYEAYWCYARRKFDKANLLFEKCLAAAKSGIALEDSFKDEFIAAFASLYLGKIQRIKSNVCAWEKFCDSALDYADRGLKLQKHTWLYDIKGCTYLELGLYQQRRHDLESAKNSYEQCVKNYQEALPLSFSTDRNLIIYKSIACAFYKLGCMENVQASDQISDLKLGLSAAEDALKIRPGYGAAEKYKAQILSAMNRRHKLPLTFAEQ